MKFFHISDLHIGKQLHTYSLIESQKDILIQIVQKAIEFKPDAILIAGDIYDKSVPSGEAYTLFDYFLKLLSDIDPKIPVLIIAGNHDSAQRLNYASSFMEKEDIHLSVMPPQEEDEFLKRVTIEDAFGKVNFYFLPFLKPGHVRHLFPDGEITSYNSAVKAVLGRETINLDERNVLLSHQFYVNGSHNPMTCQSEQSYITVGGLDSVDVSTVENFDYVALGHIHGAQSVGHKHIRYCGTPLKYSVSEENHNKSITMVTLNEKESDCLIETISLVAIRDVRSEKGNLKDIISRATKENKKDYVSVTITDENDPFRPKDQLEEVYDHILELKVDNRRTRSVLQLNEGEAINLNPIDAFKDFYEELQHVSLSKEEEALITEIVASVGGEN